MSYQLISTEDKKYLFDKVNELDQIVKTFNEEYKAIIETLIKSNNALNERVMKLENDKL